MTRGTINMWKNGEGRFVIHASVNNDVYERYFGEDSNPVNKYYYLATDATPVEGLFFVYGSVGKSQRKGKVVAHGGTFSEACKESELKAGELVGLIAEFEDLEIVS